MRTTGCEAFEIRPLKTGERSPRFWHILLASMNAVLVVHVWSFDKKSKTGVRFSRSSLSPTEEISFSFSSRCQQAAMADYDRHTSRPVSPHPAHDKLQDTRRIRGTSPDARGDSLPSTSPEHIHHPVYYVTTDDDTSVPLGDGLFYDPYEGHAAAPQPVQHPDDGRSHKQRGGPAAAVEALQKLNYTSYTTAGAHRERRPHPSSSLTPRHNQAGPKAKPWYTHWWFNISVIVFCLCQAVIGFIFGEFGHVRSTGDERY